MNPFGIFGVYEKLAELVAVVAAVLGFGAYCAYEMHAHDKVISDLEITVVRQDFAAFKAGEVAVGKQAKIRADAQTLLDKQNTENANETRRLELAARDRTIAGLRADRAARGASGGFVQTGPGTPGSPAVARFNGPLLDAAIRSLDQGVQGLVDEGTLAVIDLNSGKRWALGLKLSQSLGATP